MQYSYLLYYFQLNNKTLFLYYIVDIYSLTIKSSFNKHYQNKSSESFVQQLSNILEIKQKSFIKSIDKKRATKQNKSDIKYILQQTSTNKSTENNTTVSIFQKSDISVIDLVVVENIYSLLILSANRFILLSDRDNFQPINNILNIQQYILSDSLKSENSLLIVNNNNSQISLLDNNTLFFLFLHLQSFSSFDSKNID